MREDLLANPLHTEDDTKDNGDQDDASNNYQDDS